VLQNKEAILAIAQLERENARLANDLAILQNRLGRGDYDPTTTKVGRREEGGGRREEGGGRREEGGGSQRAEVNFVDFTPD
jgi:hypothetical protein